MTALIAFTMPLDNAQERTLAKIRPRAPVGRSQVLNASR
jgi:hypothetical protein